MQALERFARENALGGAHFTAIGAFSEAMLAYYDWEARTYREIPVREQVEVVSLSGDVPPSSSSSRRRRHGSCERTTRRAGSR